MEDLKKFFETHTRKFEEETCSLSEEKADPVAQSMAIDFGDLFPKHMQNFETLIARFTQGKNLPHELIPLAKTLLSIRPTSTAVERSFSLTGHIVSPRRTRMDVELIDCLLIVNRFYTLKSINEKKIIDLREVYPLIILIVGFF